MKTLETEITINATPQTVWSIMDDLERYPEWNALVPELRGLTVVGEVVEGKLVQPNTPVIPLSPTLTCIVGARELRWLSEVPGDQGFTAEHYFILEPTTDGGTRLIHNENFDGPAVAFLWDGVNTNGRAAYNQMNVDLKARAENMKLKQVHLHPSIDSGLPAFASSNKGTTLSCLCSDSKVEVHVSERIYHNHLCGCSKCWKPEGALFAQTAVVAAGALSVVRNEHKLTIVDASQSIQRHACTKCGTHMFGRVENKRYHFYGVEFIHPELSDDEVTLPPEFAGFVSSIIETGASPSVMEAVRKRLKEIGVPTYDAFSPELMDIIAWHQVKMKSRPL